MLGLAIARLLALCVFWFRAMAVARSVEDPDFVNVPPGKRKVVKFLAVDGKAVQFGLQRESFDPDPPNMRDAMLTLGTVNDREARGLGYLRLSWRAFLRLDPQFVRLSSVAADELGGCEARKSAGDGA